MDKNVASSGFVLALDYIKLTPVNTAPPVIEPPMLWASAQGDRLVLSWPTNATAFILEECVDLISSNWTPTLTLPSVVNGELVVATPMTEARRFYRLHQQ